METTGIIYLAMGLLTVIPLLLFNIKKVFVGQIEGGVRINWVRMVVILLICALLVVFFSTAYQKTLHNRVEIASEQLAREHAALLTGGITEEQLKAYIRENGTDNAQASLDTVKLSRIGELSSVRFLISKQCRPKYWKDVEGFDQTAVTDENNPLYMMYLLEAGDWRGYYTFRMISTDDGWKIDWFGEANEAHKSTIDMPSEINGKWHTVTA